MTWAPGLTLAELADGGQFSDGDWVESKDQDPEGSVRLTQLADVGVGEFRNRSDRWMRPDQAASLGCTFLHSNDILVARMPDPIGRACLAPLTIGNAVTAVDVAILRLARLDVDPRYVMWAINSPRFHSSVVALQSGTTRKRISRKNLASLTVPVPHLNEQRRIVDILEDHLSRLDAAGTYLAACQCRLETLVMSRLMADLRNVPTREVTLQEVFSQPLTNGRSVPTAQGGFPVLRLTALKASGVDLMESKPGAWSVDEARPYLVRHGDFLVSRGNGTLHLLARGGLVPEVTTPVAYPDTLIRVRTKEDEINPKFLSLLWGSPVVRRQIESKARTTAGIYKVNQKHLESVVLPLPALSDQAKMAVRIGQLAEATNRMSHAIAEGRRWSQTLRRALFVAAFSGRLTGRSSDLDRVEEMASP